MIKYRVGNYLKFKKAEYGGEHILQISRKCIHTEGFKLITIEDKERFWERNREISLSANTLNEYYELILGYNSTLWKVMND